MCLSFAHLLSELVVLLLNCESSLHILGTSSLLAMRFTDTSWGLRSSLCSLHHVQDCVILEAGTSYL